MSTYNLKVYGKNVRFAAKTLAQAVFARDKHIEYLRDQAAKRMAAKRARHAHNIAIIEAWAKIQRTA